MRFDKSILHLPWYKLYLSYLQRAMTKKVVANVNLVQGHFRACQACNSDEVGVDTTWIDQSTATTVDQSN